MQKLNRVKKHCGIRDSQKSDPRLGIRRSRHGGRCWFAVDSQSINELLLLVSGPRCGNSSRHGRLQVTLTVSTGLQQLCQVLKLLS